MKLPARGLALGLVASGLVGLWACSLPVVQGDPVTLWTVPGLGHVPVVLLLVGFALTGAAGALAVVRRPRPWHGGVALAGSGFCAAKLYQLFDGLFAQLASGGVLLGVAALVGVASAVAILFAAPTS